MNDKYEHIDNVKEWIDNFTKESDLNFDNFRDYAIRKLVGIIFENEKVDPEEFEALIFLYQIYRDNQ